MAVTLEFRKFRSRSVKRNTVSFRDSERGEGIPYLVFARHAEFHLDSLPPYVCRKFRTAVDQAHIFGPAVGRLRSSVSSGNHILPQRSRKQQRIVRIPKDMCIFLHAVLYF